MLKKPWNRVRIYQIISSVIVATILACSGDGTLVGIGPAKNNIVSLSLVPSQIVLPIDSNVVVSVIGTDNKSQIATLSTNLKWSLSDTTIATVNTTGQVTAISAGTTLLSVTYDTLKATATITVRPKVASITITPNTVALYQPPDSVSSVALSATFQDVKGQAIVDTSLHPTWSSSDTTIATVSSSGLVKAQKAGTTTIVTSVSGVSASTPVTVSIRGNNAQVVASLKLLTGNGDLNPTITQDSSIQFTVATLNSSAVPVTGAANVVTWTSSALSVATITPQGLLVAMSPGVSTIQATYNPNTPRADLRVLGITQRHTDNASLITLTLTVHVLPHRATKLVSVPPSIALAIDSTQTLAITALDTTGKSVTLTSRPSYTSLDTTIVKVDSTGAVRGIGIGTTTIHVVYGSIALDVPVVTSARAIAGVSITPATVTANVGMVDTLAVSVTDALGKFLSPVQVGLPTWSSSNPAVAGVTSGIVTALSLGTTTITAKYSTGPAGTSTITVAPRRVTKLVAAPVSIALAIDSTQVIAITALDTTGKSVPLIGRPTYTSAATTIASVDSTGLVKGIAVGTTTIHVVYIGATLDIPVIISGRAIAGVSITPATVTANIGAVDTLVVSATDAQGKFLSPVQIGLPTWSSSNTTVATVTSGVVTALSAGTTTISTKYSTGPTGTSVITVTAAVPLPNAPELPRQTVDVTMPPAPVMTGDTLVVPYGSDYGAGTSNAPPGSFVILEGDPNAVGAIPTPPSTNEITVTLSHIGAGTPSGSDGTVYKVRCATQYCRDYFAVAH